MGGEKHGERGLGGLLRALARGRSQPPPALDAAQVDSPRSASVRTELSTTVFGGEPGDWVPYLMRDADERYAPEVRVRVKPVSGRRRVEFDAENDDSAWLATLLNDACRLLWKAVEPKEHVATALGQLLRQGLTANRRPTWIRLSSCVPALGTRELDDPDAAHRTELRVVLQLKATRKAFEALQAAEERSSAERLGLVWTIIDRVVQLLAFPDAPRDRFVAKIDVVAKMAYVALNVLYKERRSGRLSPTGTGAVFERLEARAAGLEISELHAQHAYFRMLSGISFALRARPFESYQQDARIAAREYLDTRYLRLSLSGVMPDVAPSAQPMTFARKGAKIKTPPPRQGAFGIVDDEDLAAWKTVEPPFRELGFTLLRQLGMGQFGRVYEALNNSNSAFPERVALKVDRIIGKKKHAILEAEQAMTVGQHLAAAPHLMRLFDTGKLRGERFTYHVLQLIDGETVDSLMGEQQAIHSSLSRPVGRARSEAEVLSDVSRAVQTRQQENWRLRRRGLPFLFALSPAMLLDLITSMLLCLEEVHYLGFAINDLKNDNMMMSRRGQIKGIDLDSFSQATTAVDRYADFMFLSASLTLVLFTASTSRRSRVPWELLTQDSAMLRAELKRLWPDGVIERLSDGRVAHDEIAQVLVNLVRRSRKLKYARAPEAFSDDIAALIHVKRRLLLEELVID